jgi:hypothetical protein
MKAKRALVRAGLGIAGFCAVATAVIGVAHTPWGRPLLELPLLSAMASRAGCPVGTIEAPEFERVRRVKLQGEVGKDSAKARPALAFTLGEARRADVERWAKARQADCKTGQVASVLECSEVRVDAGPTITRLRLQFDEQDRLVSVDLFRSAAPDEALVTRFSGLADELERTVGPATTVVGEPTVAVMRSSPFQTVVRQYSYRDYVAKATLLNLGKRGLKLREQYQWLQATPPPA